jgi:hypothetical protein
MNDDLTPPPEQPMPDAARARIRADLAAAAAGPGAASGEGARRTWVVPTAAAAALLAVVAATGLVLTRTGGPDQSSERVPATSTSPSVPPTVTPSELPSPSETASAAPEKEVAPCEGAVRQVLRGATSDLELRGPEGTTTFSVAGNRSVLCDDSGGNPTVHAPHTIDPAPPVALETFEVSDTVVGEDHGRYVTAFVAGGLLPAGVESVAYTFPDSHVQEAEVRDDDHGRTWWRMVYVARRGIITEPGTNQLDLDPITVRVTGPGGTHDFTLRWALDTCAQVNHGC